jgi:hypothetical protein
MGLDLTRGRGVAESCGGASDAVIGGNRLTSEKPLLANDRKMFVDIWRPPLDTEWRVDHSGVDESSRGIDRTSGVDSTRSEPATRPVEAMLR